MAGVAASGPGGSPNKPLDCEKGDQNPAKGVLKTPKKLCKHCKRMVGLKSFADHQKTHDLEGDEHGAWAVYPCKKCQDRGRQCRIAQRPKDYLINTFRCSPCLKNREQCSFLTAVRHLGGNLPDVHPGLTMGSPSDESGSSETSREPSESKESLYEEKEKKEE